MNSIFGDSKTKTKKKFHHSLSSPLSLSLFLSQSPNFSSLLIHISHLNEFDVWIDPPPHLSLILRFPGESPVAFPIRLEAAVLDLVADDSGGMQKQKSRFHWDKRSKKYIKLNNGDRVTASGKSTEC
ncbi:uncharacterized protein LOC114298234 [Camellia sinensis]|uniref:uncharacterized protein LOC114298234 n=1 Tax=Camellia sinensis TaxID=4442 RepID=UPI001036F163|nr:uncharacterized protein LOC114298234 [Camellia sinensis]